MSHCRPLEVIDFKSHDLAQRRDSLKAVTVTQ